MFLNKNILIIFFVICFFPSFCFANFDFLLLDADLLLERSTLGKKITQELQEESKGALSTMQKNLEKMQKLEKDIDSLNEKERSLNEEKIDALKKENNDIQESLKRRHENILKRFETIIQKECKKIMRKYKSKMVLHRNAVFYLKDDSIDITLDIVNEIDKQTDKFVL